MSLEACAGLVERGDPDRFATARGPAAEHLLPLYAFNLEIARAPWVTSEPMIARMRLAWWHEAVDEIAAGAPPRAHEVVAPLARVMTGANLPPEPLHRMIEAREWDVEGAPFPDAAALWAHLQATAGTLMWLAARALGAPESAEATVTEFGTAAGLAAWLRAAPRLAALNREPLPAGTGIADLAQEGRARLAAARARRAEVPAAALPALLVGWEADAVLKRAARDPAAVTGDRLGRSEFARRAGLAARALTGRW